MDLKSWLDRLLGNPVMVSDLVDFASVEVDDPYALLTSLYAWKAEHISAIAKALTGAGAALALATLVPLIQVDPSKPIGWWWMFVAWLAAAILIGIGMLAFALVRRLHGEYAAAQALLGELVEIRPFLRAYRAVGDNE